LKWIGVALGVYVALIVAFESLVLFMGKRQADRGLRPDELWLALTTTDAQGPHVTIVAGVEVDGQLYVSANHWPRGWYHRALAHPEVEVERAGKRGPYRAVPVEGPERARVVEQYRLPFPLRILSGFPPRSFLRLVPVERPETPGP
jgi:hypothetical protein